MATLLLSAAGAAIGGSLGGTVFGLSSVVAGRFAGAVLGRAIDQRLMGQGSDPVETGRVDRLRIMGAGEGEGIARIHGRMKVAGQVIWASQFAEIVTQTGGGKGTPQPATRRYSYRVSLAVALCEGEISGVGRVWADGAEIAPSLLNMRVYTGALDQLPDPKMEAVEGAGEVPAYRGTAYVVIEDLALDTWHNRVPQFAFEVIRPAAETLGRQGAGQEPGDAPVFGQPVASENGGPTLNALVPDPARAIRAVAMIPGCGEYALATSQVSFRHGAGAVEMANVNSASGQSDFSTSLDQLGQEVPGCDHVSMVVSWFGDDLRCGFCRIRPAVERRDREGAEMPWQVAGMTRNTADQVPQDADGRPIYGGTPCDTSVIEAIQDMNARGLKVMYYPFVLMTQGANNGLPDPYGESEQGALPWRGRITASIAPGQAGSPDATLAAATEVAGFFGSAQASDFLITPGGVGSTGGVSYTGAQDWGYRRFVLHQAGLCAAAGGVDAFCIGSEMVGLTRLRDAAGFPAVAALIDLAAQVRQILGPETKISYAADWTEYAGFSPAGTADRYFHLDPLWADQNIDFVGIDNYFPLSDWRDGHDHADADWESVHSLDYLRANIEGGELFDWYYSSENARDAQLRTPITDGTHDEPWIWRIKDIRAFWTNAHHERIAGVRQTTPTSWVPQSKPIWFTELGCASVDKGTNQPNKFVDPKSSESGLPHYSSGRRDDVIAMQYLRAMLSYWGEGTNNPMSAVYGAPMVDMARAHVWAWDARPFPWFPNNRSVWADGANYARGHWLSGRASARSLAGVVAEICAASGVFDVDVSDLRGVVWGYAEQSGGTGRQALQPLMLRFGFDAVDRGGILRFVMRDGRVDAQLDRDFLCVTGDLDGVVEEVRAADAEIAGRVRVQFIEQGADFAAAAEEAVLPALDGTFGPDIVAGQELHLSMLRGEGRQVAQRWLAEAEVARDTVRFALPLSRADLGAGDVVRLGLMPDNGVGDIYRIDRVERGAFQLVDAARIDPETYRPLDIADGSVRQSAFVPPVPVFPLFLDLPLMRGDEVPHAPHLAVSAKPWPGTVAIYGAEQDEDYSLDRVLDVRSVIGVTETPLLRAAPGLIDRGAPLSVRLTSGELTSVNSDALLAGKNLMAIGDGRPDGWELFQFRDVVPGGDGLFLVSHRLRGQLGSDADMPEVWPAGSYVVLMDGTPEQIGLTPAQRGYARHYRIGPALRDYSDATYDHQVHAFSGIGLRPLSPVHLRKHDLAGDLAMSWIRRTRTGGDSWDTPEVALGEESEAYVLRVMQGPQIVREVNVSTPNWTYTQAAQVEDGGIAGRRIEVAQISALYGAGPWTGCDL